MTTATVGSVPPARHADDGGAAGVRLAVGLVVVLVVVGAVLGLVWQAWSPPGPLAAVQAGGIQADETEAWAAGDGRFAIIALAVGLLAGLLVWFVRGLRGPLGVLALMTGGLAGAAVTNAIGHVVRGPGTTYSCGSDTGRCIEHLPLTVHMPALYLLEPLAAVLVYGLLVAFAARDDLGRADGWRRPASVPAGRDPQDGWGYRDGAGALQQGDLPTK
jgi:hypothetical protein